MPSFDDVPSHSLALSTAIQQVIDALTGRRNTPLSSVVNDPLAYALTIKNSDPAGRGAIIFAPDGTTVLFQVDATGAKLSRAGGAAQTPLTDVGSAAGQAAEGNHIHGVGGYASSGAGSLESMFSGSEVVTAFNYTVTSAVSYVFCTSGVVITLPAAASTHRPITITAVTGTSTVTASAGTVVGGSINATTGLVMDGVVSPGESMTYKSDGVSVWRVVGA